MYTYSYLRTLPDNYDHIHHDIRHDKYPSMYQHMQLHTYSHNQRNRPTSFQ